MNRTRFISGLLLAVVILTFGSCKKDEDPEPVNPAGPEPTGTLMFHLHTYLDINEVDAYNIVYTTDAGRKVSMSIGQLYISGIQLERPDGSLYDVPDTKLLKVLDTETYLIGDVPAGSYKTVRFKVGLDSVTNGMLPAASADSVLLNHSEMWLGASPQPDGYTFLNFEGKIDTTAAATATTAQMQPFAFHIGTNAHYAQVVMPDHPFTIVEDQVEFVHIIADYFHLFSGVQLNQASNLSVISAADNATATGNQVAANIAGMFIYE